MSLERSDLICRSDARVITTPWRAPIRRRTWRFLVARFQNYNDRPPLTMAAVARPIGWNGRYVEPTVVNSSRLMISQASSRPSTVWTVALPGYFALLAIP